VCELIKPIPEKQLIP
jgi:hypothetical protein